MSGHVADVVGVGWHGKGKCEMKVKLVGFKVGQSRPTSNRTVNIREAFHKSLNVSVEHVKDMTMLGRILIQVLEKSDFISIRRVDG